MKWSLFPMEKIGRGQIKIMLLFLSAVFYYKDMIYFSSCWSIHGSIFWHSDTEVPKYPEKQI